jgi:ABC-type sugar transport system substrate-binding protein
MKALRLTAPLVATVCAALVLAGCSSSATNSGTAGKQLVIGWANPQAKQPQFQTFTDALNAAAAREHVKVITLDGQANPSVQVSNIQTFITDHVDAIIVFPDDVNALNPSLTKAAQAGIKIVALNAFEPAAAKATPQVPAPYSTDLDWGYVDGPYLMGKYVAKQLNGKGNVVGIKIPVPVPSLNAMLAADQRYVTEGNPGIRWLGTLPDATDDLAGARSSMADAITRFKGNIQAVMSYTDIGGIGARQALTAAGIKNVVIVGSEGNQTGIDALKAGQIQGDVDYQPYTAAVWALAMAKKVVNNEPFPKFVRLPIKFYTQDNVDSYRPWTEGVNDIKTGKTSLNVTFSGS